MAKTTILVSLEIDCDGEFCGPCREMQLGLSADWVRRCRVVGVTLDVRDGKTLRCPACLAATEGKEAENV